MFIYLLSKCKQTYAYLGNKNVHVYIHGEAIKDRIYLRCLLIFQACTNTEDDLRTTYLYIGAAKQENRSSWCLTKPDTNRPVQ